MMESAADEVHYIGIGCYLNLGDIENGHYAMYVQHEQSDYWQIFKTYWDIVVSQDSNIIADYSDYFVGVDKNNSNCYYAIDSQYEIFDYHTKVKD